MIRTILLRSPSGRIALASLCSRVLGFVRLTLLISAVGGTSSAVGGQVFEVANSAPTYLYGLIAGGVLGAVLIPTIVKARRSGSEGVALLERMLTGCLLGAAVVTVALTFAAPLVVSLYASRWSESWSGLATQMAYWCLPQVFFYVVFAVGAQLLNASEKYGPAAWAPGAANLVAVLGIAAFMVVYPEAAEKPVAEWTSGMVALLCGTATASIAVQGLITVLFLRSTGYTFRLRLGFGGLASVSRDASWVFGGVLAAEAAYIVVSNVATAAGESLNERGVDGASLNSYSSALLLFLLPHGIVVASVTTAMFTPLSTAVRDGDLSAAVGNLRRTEDVVLLLTSLSTVLYLGAAPLLTNVLWGTPLIGEVLQILAVGLIGFSLTYVLNRAMFALGRARDSLVTQFVSSGCVALAAGIGGSMLEPALVVPAIAAATSVGSLASWGVAHHLVRRRLRTLTGGASGLLDHRSSRRRWAPFAALSGSGSLALLIDSTVSSPGDLVAELGLLTGTVLVIAGAYCLVYRLIGRIWPWAALREH